MIPLATRTLADDVEFMLITPTDPELDGNPPGLYFTDGAYDPVREKLVFYGGRLLAGGTRHEKIWEFDGTSWDDKGSFSAVDQVVSAYDPVNSIMLHAYGSYPASGVDEVRAWDGTTLTNLPISDPEGDGRPGDIGNLSAIFDLNTNRMISFGGFNGAYQGQTWSWTGISWDLLIPSDPEGDGNPVARANHAFGFDEARSRGCLFGGIGVGNSIISESSAVWEWDGTSWERIVPTDPEGDGNPAGRRDARLIYHPALSRVVLIGGNDNSSNEFQEVWDWNGVSLRQHSIVDGLGDGTPDFSFGTADYMANIGKIVIFGHAGSPADQTWALEFSSVPVELSEFEVQ